MFDNGGEAAVVCEKSDAAGAGAGAEGAGVEPNKPRISSTVLFDDAGVGVLVVGAEDVDDEPKISASRSWLFWAAAAA